MIGILTMASHLTNKTTSSSYVTKMLVAPTKLHHAPGVFVKSLNAFGNN